MHLSNGSDGQLPSGGDLVSTMPGCVCLKVKDMGLFFLLQENEMNEKISFNMGVKSAPFHMVIGLLRCIV